MCRSNLNWRVKRQGFSKESSGTGIAASCDPQNRQARHQPTLIYADPGSARGAHLEPDPSQKDSEGTGPCECMRPLPERISDSEFVCLYCYAALYLSLVLFFSAGGRKGKLIILRLPSVRRDLWKARKVKGGDGRARDGCMKVAFG